MIDCRESKKRYRFDHIKGRWVEGLKHGENGAPAAKVRVFVTTIETENELDALEQAAMKFFGLRKKDAESLVWDGEIQGIDSFENNDFSQVLGPDAKHVGTLTEPREFNLMFKTTVGALFKNVVDSVQARVPFGVGQIGKSFRNEITPRNFTFRSREFEQMEIEFFCHPSESEKWYRFWRDRRFQWYVDMGLAGERLRMREHEPAELAHYSVGTADIEYAFPFLPEGEFGELEGVAHRGDFDLRSHAEGKLVREGDALVLEKDANGAPKWRGSGKDMSFYDDLRKERFIPHVIEPSSGADRATLAFLCESYKVDKAPTSEAGKEEDRVYLKLHPRLAPVKAAILPLVKKDGMSFFDGACVEGEQVAGACLLEDLQAAFHFADGPFQGEGDLFRIENDRCEQMRKFLVGSEFDLLGVDHDQLQLVRAVFIEHGHDDDVHADGFARAGGAGDQKVRRLGEIDDDGLASDVLAQQERQVAFGGAPCGIF